VLHARAGGATSEDKCHVGSIHWSCNGHHNVLVYMLAKLQNGLQLSFVPWWGVLYKPSKLDVRASPPGRLKTVSQTVCLGWPTEWLWEAVPPARPARSAVNPFDPR
jgi:hypothetical protein